MRADKKRKSGFYWVQLSDRGRLVAPVVAEYTADGVGCSPEDPHWHIPGVWGCWRNRDLGALLSGPIPTADQLQAIPDLLKVARMADHLARMEMAGRPIGLINLSNQELARNFIDACRAILKALETKPSKP